MSVGGADAWVRADVTTEQYSLASPEILAASIIEDLQTALEQFAAIAEGVGANITVGGK